MITGAKIALWMGIAVPAMGGGGYVAKLVGDTLWLPINDYKQSELYKLQDRIFEYEQIEKYERPLSRSEQEIIDRLRQREKRFKDELD